MKEFKRDYDNEYKKDNPKMLKLAYDYIVKNYDVDMDRIGNTYKGQVWGTYSKKPGKKKKKFLSIEWAMNVESLPNLYGYLSLNFGHEGQDGYEIWTMQHLQDELNDHNVPKLNEEGVMKKLELIEMIKEEMTSYNPKQKLTEAETNIMKMDKATQMKVIAQYEAIRQAGQYNMYDFLKVQRQAHENKFYDLVSFTANNSKAYASIMINYSKLIKMLSNKSTPIAKKLITKYKLEEGRFVEGCKKEGKVFNKNQIAIAKKTLKMSDAGANAMGGMTKDEARAILKKHKVKVKEGKVPSLKAELLKKYGNDPIYRDVINAKNKKIFDKEVNILKSIRGEQAYRNMQAFSRNFTRRNKK